MAFVPSKLEQTFKIQCPGAEMNAELENVFFEMREKYFLVKLKHLDF